MEKKQKIKITNPSQMESLVSAMEQNVEIARGRGKNGLAKINSKVFWSNLAEKLNSLGPPIRDGTGWLKVWNDQKYSVKQKMRKNNDLNATENGPIKLTFLSSTEKTIARILHLGNVKTEFYVKSDISEMVSNSDECTDNENESSNIIQTPSTPEEPNEGISNIFESVEEKISLLAEQTRLQTSILKEQKCTNRLLRKILKCKEEKLSLRKKEYLDKKRFRTRILKLKAKKLGIFQMLSIFGSRD